MEPRIALNSAEKFCFYLNGGMHHAHWNYGSGFCPVNDLVITIRLLQKEQKIRTAWIVDVDAHKGDGTAALTANDSSIQTVSVHMANGWPMTQPKTLAGGKPNPAFVPSTIDVPVAEGEESDYMPHLQNAMAEMVDRFPLPDFLLVVDGADPYEKDGLASTELIQLSLAQLLERDIFLYEFAQKHSVPCLFVMAGNYGDYSWEVYTNFLSWQLESVLC